MKRLYTIPKFISEPVVPIKGSWIDGFPLILMFLLFVISLWLIIRPRKHNQAFRFVIRSVSFFIFVFFLFKCLCVAKLAIFGLSEIGKDDLLSFGQLWLFAIVGSFTFIGGRIFCGWICPLGFLQEMVHFISPKLNKRLRTAWLILVLITTLGFLYFTMPANEFAFEFVIAIFATMMVVILILVQFKPEWERHLLKIKYPLLALYAFISVFAVYFSETWCPLYGSEVDYSAITAILVVTLASVAVSMPWCRYMCPTGLFLALMSRKALFRIKGSCRNCGSQCSDICPTGALNRGKIDDLLCISCTRCVQNCGCTVTNTEVLKEQDEAS